MDDTTTLVALPGSLCSTRCSLHNLVHKGGLVGEELGQPEYRRLMQDLRGQIADGRLPIGRPIPSTASLGQQYGVSSTVVRRAVSELRAEGLLYGHPGKGVFVKAKPAEAVDERQVIERLAAGLNEVAAKVDSLEVVDSETLEAVRRELAELRAVVGVLQTQLIELYGRVGQPYPKEAAPLRDDSSSAKRRRAAGA
ncbi:MULTISPECIES: GntR family transcriptional regulator [unclassified Streptomyces]|uniref:GntR family transcriptional regulator n=1 Tax=unclassified Streptomyces TaxID=2593676 RepID=UPI003701043D